MSLDDRLTRLSCNLMQDWEEERNHRPKKNRGKNRHNKSIKQPWHIPAVAETPPHLASVSIEEDSPREKSVFLTPPAAAQNRQGEQTPESNKSIKRPKIKDNTKKQSQSPYPASHQYSIEMGFQSPPPAAERRRQEIESENIEISFKHPLNGMNNTPRRVAITTYKGDETNSPQAHFTQRGSEEAIAAVSPWSTTSMIFRRAFYNDPEYSNLFFHHQTGSSRLLINFRTDC